MKHMRFITGFMTAVMLTGYMCNTYAFAAEKETVTSSEAIEASGNSVSVTEADEKVSHKEKETSIEDTTYTYEYSDYSVDYTVTSHWDDRCNVVVDIKNKTDQMIHNWNLTFCTDDEMLGLYNAKIVSEEAVDEDDSVRKITIKNLGYNQDIKANSSVRFGFQIKYSNGFTIPDSFYMSTADTVVDEADYIVENNITSSWATGCTGELQITNTRDTAIEDWVLSIESESEPVNVWGASIAKTGENLYELECPEYAQNIDAGKKSVIGYQLKDSDNTIVVMGLRERNRSIDNTISENSASENSVSENTEAGKYIVLDKEGYDTESGIPVIFKKVDLIKGVLNHAEEVESVFYKVNDMLGDTVKSGTLDITDNEWEAKKIGFSIGENELVFRILLKNGDVVNESMTIINVDVSNLENTDVDMEDSDGDGIQNYIETLIHTDKDQMDTDHDGLTDYQEVFYFGYDPISPDTDDDGIMDKDEDEDGDGISNDDENALGSDPLSYDSDLDGLDDATELEYGTSLILPDTDNDGISDYDEYTLDKIGASHNDDGTYTATFRADMSEIPYDKAVIPTVTLTGDVEGITGFSMEMVEFNSLFDPSMVGYMGHAYDFKTDGSMSGAELTFTYDESLIDADMLASPDFHPAIYYYNPDDDSLTEVEDQTWTGNRVSVHLNHFSVYILGNKSTLEALGNSHFDTGLYGISNSGESKKETGKLVLNVTDSDGNPVSDADVLIFRQSMYGRYGNRIMVFDGMDSSTFLMKGRTDKDGKFKCELESKTIDCSGSYTILVDKDGAFGAKARIGEFYGEAFHDSLTEGDVKNVDVTLGKYSGTENGKVSFYVYDGNDQGNSSVLYSYNLRLYKGWGITDFGTPVIDTKSPEEAWFKEVFDVEVPCGRYTVEIEKEGFPVKYKEILVTDNLETPYLVAMGKADSLVYSEGIDILDRAKTAISDPNAKYVGVIYLNKEQGAKGNGHAAILLVKDDGTGDFFSYASNRDVMIGYRGQGYLARAVEKPEPHHPTSIDVGSFLRYGKVYTDTVGVIHPIKERDKRYGVDGAYDTDDTPYNRGFYIPVTNEEGKAMFDRALEIRKNPGFYDLIFKNCGHVSQDILEAGGKKFSADSNEAAIVAIIYALGMRHPVGAGLVYADYYYTRPNRTYENADVNDFPGSYKGTLEEIYDYLYK